MRDLSLDQLRSFLTIVDLGGFSAAARHLNLSQPAVSVQIRELESRLGLRLLERLGKRAFPTAAGLELADHARALLAAGEAALAAMRRHRDGFLGKVRIGTGRATLTYLLPPVLRALRDQHPNIDVSVLTGTTLQMIEDIAANRIDIGVVTLPARHPGIEVTPIDERELVAIVPVEAGEPPPPHLGPGDLAGRPLVLEDLHSNLTTLALDWLAAGGVRPDPVLTYDSLEAVKAIVGTGLGYSILQAEAAVGGVAADRLHVRPLVPRLTRRLALAQRRDKPADRAFAIVREALLGLAAVKP
ncbi:LysR family transcriptional regulator [Zavarzinia compransoris]|uniref:LysR family transcriptional regulator n=1 Tax=Zavarzinia compransoris TaxID=1264899 RepID=A0A317E0W3_9PROT|nr:LysR family transcriptional regulator [Zavarzinia compransoris]PWR20589.1 LysR family transcriptional regulator [Zavarzinia compransoris]TDP43765.1 DNA-binding transcriptional LysR family regulator [Zavarzinia compransoris]